MAKSFTEECDKCPALVKSATCHCMQGTGEVGSALMIVGEAPGKEEDEAGVPFVGRSGRFLRKQLFLAAGIDGSEVYITNAVRCRPPGNKTPKTRELRNCRDRLAAEIHRVKPKVLVLLGNAPLAALLYLDKVSGITKWRGKPLWSAEFQCWIIATFHPSALLRDKSLGITYRQAYAVDDLELAVQLTTRKPPVLNVPKPLIYTEPGKLQAYLRAARGSGKVAVDLETHLFKPTNDILGVSLCFQGSTGVEHPAYFEWSILDDPTCHNLFIEILQDPTVTKLFHNCAFDQKFLHYHGVEAAGPIRDTMVAAHLLDENFSAALKENAWRYLGLGGYDLPLDMYKWENKFKKGQSYRTIPFDILAPYAAMDALATYRLDALLEPKLRAEGSYALYEKVLMPVRQVMTSAEIEGFRVATGRAAILEERIDRAKQVLIKKIYEVAGHEFNIGSNKELGKVLFEELGLTPSTQTKTGQNSVDAAALTLMAGQRKRGAKLAKYLLQYKKVEKLQGTYVTPVQKHVWDDGRVHSSFRMTGTVTGRTSNADPCTHNIPKDRLVRSLYLPSEGNVLVEADIKAAELRAMALYSGEPVFLRAFEEGRDIHTATFQTVFGKDLDYEPTQDERRVAKIINFGLIYGISASGLSLRAKIPKAQAVDFMETYFKRLPRVRDFINQSVRTARKRGYVESMFKRRRRLPDIQGDDKALVRRCARQAVNAVVQSAAADYTYIGIVRVDRAIKKAGLSSKIIHTVHDCVIVDTVPAEVDQVRQIIQTAFETPVKAFPIKMEVDIKVVSAWGDDNESNLEELFQELEIAA